MLPSSRRPLDCPSQTQVGSQRSRSTPRLSRSCSTTECSLRFPPDRKCRSESLRALPSSAADLVCRRCMSSCHPRRPCSNACNRSVSGPSATMSNLPAWQAKTQSGGPPQSESFVHAAPPDAQAPVAGQMCDPQPSGNCGAQRWPVAAFTRRPEHRAAFGAPRDFKLSDFVITCALERPARGRPRRSFRDVF